MNHEGFGAEPHTRALMREEILTMTIQATQTLRSVRRTALPILLMLVAFGSAKAGVTFHTDIQQFSANSTTVIVEGFERYFDADQSLSSVIRNGNTYRPTGVSANVRIATAQSSQVFSVASNKRTNVLTADGLEEIQIEFGESQHAVGFDTFLNGSPAIVRIYGVGGRLIGQREHSHSQNLIGFIGVVSTEVITAVGWAARGNAGINTGIDNIRGAGISRVSVGVVGAEGDNDSWQPTLSADGRYLTYYGHDTALVTGDVNGEYDVFVRDLASAETSLVSVDSNGTQGNGGSFSPVLSADGRFVAFESFASNLVAEDNNGANDVFVQDRTTGETTRVSVTSTGIEGDYGSYSPSISANGRYVAFWSLATNLVASDSNSASDAFVHDRDTGETIRVSIDSAGMQGDGGSANVVLSADGRYVAFISSSSNLVAGDTNGSRDVFVHELTTRETTRISVDNASGQGNGESSSPSFSADGRYVAFASSSTNLTEDDTNETSDIFVYDRVSGVTTRESVDSRDSQSNGASGSPQLSADGRYVGFVSVASNLVPEDTNGKADYVVRDRTTGNTFLVGIGSTGMQGEHLKPSILSLSADGRFVAFDSSDANLVAGDTNRKDDIFVRVIDQDGDGMPDGRDNCVGVANSAQTNSDSDRHGNACDDDDDNDGMPDTFEVTHGLNSIDASDASEDADGDGETNLAEYSARTDPLDPSSKRESHERRIPAVMGIITAILLDD